MTQNKITEDYHKWYYDNDVFFKVKFLGVPCLKSVNDLWSYQEIIFELKPKLIVEFGTLKGGSALYLAKTAGMVMEKFKVLTVDIDHGKVFPQVRQNPDIEFLNCSSADSQTAERIAALREEYGGPVFAIIDSDHRMEHVLNEMLLLRPLLKRGDHLIVEDGNLNGHPVKPGWGPGPFEAIHEYEKMHPDDYRHDERRENKFGFTFAPYGFLVRN